MTPTAQPPDSVQPTPTIQQVINYPQPSISKINVEVFRQAAGLPASKEPFSVSIESLNKSNPLASLDCLTIAEPNALLGALEPPYPMATCTAETHVDQGLYRVGCMFPGVMRYVVYRDGKFQSVASREELQALFAPITSENEALSYALALTGDEAKYGLNNQWC
jgi:hypothetical protein